MKHPPRTLHEILIGSCSRILISWRLNIIPIQPGCKIPLYTANHQGLDHCSMVQKKIFQQRYLPIVRIVGLIWGNDHIRHPTFGKANIIVTFGKGYVCLCAPMMPSNQLPRICHTFWEYSPLELFEF